MPPENTTVPSAPEPQVLTSHHWRKLPWVALALLLGAQLWLLPYPRAYLVFGAIRLAALGFVAAVTLLSFLVRSRSVKLAAVLLSALLFVRFVQLHRHLALLHELHAAAPEACRGLPETGGASDDALARALSATGRSSEQDVPFVILCSREGASVLRPGGYWDGFESLSTFDAQDRLVGF